MTYIRSANYPQVAAPKMFFKQVKPHPAFVNGQKVIVEKINVTSIMDDLKENVTFKYTLADANEVFAGEGYYSLDASNYTDWDASAAGAYKMVCSGIGLELVE